jgi:DNA-binding transcriptional ArsR family regulator
MMACIAIMPESSNVIAPITFGERTASGVLMVSRPVLKNANEAATLLTLLGNEKRLAILSLLLDDEMSVGAIAEKVELSQSALSQHLAKLRNVELVETRRDRQMIYYSCNSDAVRQC